MRLSDKDISFSRYSRPQDTDHTPSQGISALLGLTALGRSHRRETESNQSGANKSSFVQIQSNRQRLPAQSLDDAQEWNVWEGTEHVPVNSQGKVPQIDFLECFFKLTTSIPIDLEYFEAESVSVPNRRQFLYTHHRAKNLYCIRPGSSLNVLDSHNFKHWKVTPLFDNQARGYYRQLKLADPMHESSPSIFCVKQSLDPQEDDELIYFEGLFRDPTSTLKYNKTLIVKTKAIKDYEVKKTQKAFILLIITDTHYLQVAYAPVKGRVAKLGVAPRVYEEREQLINIEEAVWLGANESLHCWNLVTNEIRQITLNIRKEKMTLKLTKSFLVLVKTKLFYGPLILIILSRELEVLQRLQIDKLASSEVKCVKESNQFILVLLDTEIVRIDTNTWKYKKYFISLQRDSFRNSILITTSHLNILLGLSKKEELIYSWNPT